MKEHVNNYIKQYNSFSGTDMTANIHIIGPDGNPKTYTLGTLQTLTTSVHMDRKPIRSIGNINVKDYVMGPRTIAGTLIFAVFNKHFAYEAIDSILEDNDYDRHFSFLADELPPFDITISFANEYGCKARLAIYGIRLINEGQVMSINDIYTENTYQYVATDYEYLSDDNGHSSYYTNKNTKIVSSKEIESLEPNNKMTAQDLKNNSLIQQEYDNENKHNIKISCQTTNAKNVDSLGKVKIVLSPSQSTGVLHVGETCGGASRHVSIQDFPNAPIFMALKPGQYYVSYQSAEDKNRTDSQFYIGYNSKQRQQVNMPPTIEKRTHENIVVIPNNKSHDTVKYKKIDNTKSKNKPNDVEGRWLNKTIANNKVTLKNLEPGAFYEVYTYNKDSSEDSGKIIVNTLQSSDIRYEYFLEQIKFNIDNLSSNFDLYSAIVSMCKNKSKKYDNEISILDSLLRTHAELRKIVSEDKYDAYETAIKEIIEFAEKITNDEFYYVNSNCEMNINKQPRILNKTKNTIELNDNIKSVDVYIDKNKRSTFYKTIINDGKKNYDIVGIPGKKYTLIGTGKYDEVNPTTEIYSLTDEDKSKYYNSNDKNEINSVLNESLKSIKEYTDITKLNTKTCSRIVNQNAKRARMSILRTPFVEDIVDNNIIINLNNAENLLNQESSYYLVVSNDIDLFKNNIKNKMPINNTKKRIVINTEFCVVKNEEVYYIWIENEKGKQVSDCFSFIVNDDNNRDFVDNIMVKNTIDKIISVLDIRNMDNDYLKDLFFSLKTDTTLNQKNLYKNIIDRILSYNLGIIDTDLFLNKILKARTDLDYCTDPSFFDRPVIINNYAIQFPKLTQDYEVIEYKIKNNKGIIKYEISNILINNSKEFYVDEDFDYTIYVCQNHNNISIKSGFILINNSINKKYCYKINKKEMD